METVKQDLPTGKKLDIDEILNSRKGEEKEEKRFQHYSSARSAVRLITESGMVINFVNFQYITDSREAISYLDSQITRGLPGITRGEALTATEADPVLSVKKKIINEFLEDLRKKQEEAIIGDKDFGGTDDKRLFKGTSTKDQPK